MIHLYKNFINTQTHSQGRQIHLRFLVVGFLVCGFFAAWPWADLVASVDQGVRSMSSRSNAVEAEYQIKAAFVYNFMKFTEWPDEKGAASSDESPMIIGILGDNPFGKSFVPIQEKTIREHPIQVVEFPSFLEFRRQYKSTNEAANKYSLTYKNKMHTCHVLFICDSEKSNIAVLLPMLQQGKVLIVSDIPRFIDNGGIIGFIKQDNKIRFEINMDESEEQGLHISSQLLKLAVRVKKDK